MIMYRKYDIETANKVAYSIADSGAAVALSVPCGTNHGGVLVESEVSLSKEVWCPCHRNHASLMP